MGYRRTLMAAALAATVAFGAAVPGAAWAAGSLQPLEAVAENAVQLGRVDAQPVPVACQPASIECGVPCGMTEMCGLDPCLCGPVDGFGACACNGLQTVRPAFSLDDDGGGHVALVELFGTAYLVPLAEGPADVVVRASLPHHVDALVSVHVEVAPAGPGDVLKVLAALAVAAGVAVAAAFAARRCVRAGKRALLLRRIKKEEL